MNKNNIRYPLFKGWGHLFDALDMPTQKVLQTASLPLDLFRQAHPTITASEYFKLWEALLMTLDNEPTFPIRMAKQITPETLSPVMFACLSSTDLETALQRIATYKIIEGPIRLSVLSKKDEVTVTFKSAEKGVSLPVALVGFEIAFWVKMVRIATRKNIAPLRVSVVAELPKQKEYEKYIGSKIDISKNVSMTFSKEDATWPFITTNDAMWSIFEENFSRKLRDFKHNTKTSLIVSKWLVELLPSGNCSLHTLAEKLKMNERTLQRRLMEEGTSFQKMLGDIRKKLSMEYLSSTDYSKLEISFLLCYAEPNSFYRAFKKWTGFTPDQYRNNLNSNSECF